MNFEDFLYEEFEGIIIETINISRATTKETEAFRNRMTKNIESGKTDIIVDLSLCDYCDSSFIGALVVCTKKADLAKGTFAVVIPEDSDMSHLIQSSRLDKVLRIFRTKEDALMYFTNKNSSNT